ncbi:nucleotide-binding protein [Rhodococcus cercidiphylli]|uniref:Nucleotide-binding protein n=1 Tax=Rhodococcus cercidiphylli TaxID=489916 RepID=A0ABU4B2H9_9NOCA|nr:nucleotide-binding protein [Rhodococcus cercidiphylli]MDV6232687.1 nucleotide-binding protein [Rhodococcus cercidiphylli]
MAGLDWDGTNKQDRVQNALWHADDGPAVEAVYELVRVLRDQGTFTRATHDETVGVNVARIRKTLREHGLVLTESGELEEHDGPEDDDGSAHAAGSSVGSADADGNSADTETAARSVPDREAAPAFTTAHSNTGSPNPRLVFLVHGRDHRIKASMVDLIEAFDLKVLEWEDAAKYTGMPSPTTMQIVSAGMEAAAAIVVLFTPDDEGRCREPFQSEHDGPQEKEYTPQARMNVIFEAGMAMYKDPQKTLLVRFGSVREMSDIAGVNYIQIKDTLDARRAIGNRLTLAGADVDISREKWRTAGDFTMPVVTSPSSLTPSASGPTVQPEPPPENLAVTVTTYLSTPGSTRQYEALVKKMARTLRIEINTLPLTDEGDEPLESLEGRYRKLFELSNPLLAVLKTSLDFGTDGIKKSTWSEALQNLVDARNKVRTPSGSVLWTAPDRRYEQARHLPALLALRVAGLTALCCNDSAATLWVDMGKEVTWRPPERSAPLPKKAALEILDEYEVLDERSVSEFAALRSNPAATTALGRYLRKLLRPLFEDECPSDDDWEDINDQFEYRRAMLYVRRGLDVPPALAATGSGRWTSAGWKPEIDFLSAAESAPDDWPWWQIVGDPQQVGTATSKVRLQLGERFGRRY